MFLLVCLLALFGDQWFILLVLWWNSFFLWAAITSKSLLCKMNEAQFNSCSELALGILPPNELLLLEHAHFPGVWAWELGSTFRGVVCESKPNHTKWRRETFHSSRAHKCVPALKSDHLKTCLWKSYNLSLIQSLVRSEGRRSPSFSTVRFHSSRSFGLKCEQLLRRGRAGTYFFKPAMRYMLLGSSRNTWSVRTA